MCGFPPFYDDDDELVCEKIIAGEWQFLKPWWDDVSEGAKQLVSKCMSLTPEDRPSCEEILNDEWMTSDPTVLRTKVLDIKSELAKYNARRKFRAGIMLARISGVTSSNFFIIYTVLTQRSLRSLTGFHSCRKEK